MRFHNNPRRDINKDLAMLGVATENVAMTWNPQPETPMTSHLNELEAAAGLQFSILQGRQGLPACKGARARV